MLGSRGMIGLIVPSNNTVILPEFYSALPDGVAAYETRMRVEGDLTPETLRKMVGDAEVAADLLRQTGVDFICYCCMASTIVKGWDWERDLLARFSTKARKGVTSANCALRDALTVLGAKRVALVTPYPEDLNALLPAFFSAGGFEVAQSQARPSGMLRRCAGSRPIRSCAARVASTRLALMRSVCSQPIWQTFPNHRSSRSGKSAVPS